MKFKQLSTGAVLETNNEAVIAMMTASNAYVAVKQQKAKPDKGNDGGKNASKGDKPAEGDKPTEDDKPAE